MAVHERPNDDDDELWLSIALNVDAKGAKGVGTSNNNNNNNNNHKTRTSYLVERGGNLSISSFLVEAFPGAGWGPLHPETSTSLLSHDCYMPEEALLTWISFRLVPLGGALADECAPE